MVFHAIVGTAGIIKKILWTLKSNRLLGTQVIDNLECFTDGV